MKLKEIERTSTFAWAPTSQPLLATGTVAGALDASFTNQGQLEIWELDFMDKSELRLGGEKQGGPSASVTTTSRFNRLVWGVGDSSKPKGVIAAGMENGELNLWDPSKIVSSAEPSEQLIFSNTQHTGPVRGLDFNPLQHHLLSSGGTNGEVYVWDLKNPGTPYTPGARSSKLDEITALAWNNHVPHVLGTSSSSGYTVVWDLRGKREVTALQYGGGAGTTGGSSVLQGGGVLALGSRRGMSAIAWHPDNATRVITASEDDNSPIIMVWDLRNSRAPEKILTGHQKGVLSLSWCKQDSDLLLSCGKDNRALVWNPQTSELIGELPAANNWAFHVEWSPRNPDIFATAFFDGTIGIHSLQSTNEPTTTSSTVPQQDNVDIFDQGPTFTSQPPLSLKQPPKWLRRPSSASFGFGGKLASVSNLASAQGTSQSRVVHLRTLVTENEIVDRAQKLKTAAESQTLSTFCEQKSAEAEKGDGDGDGATAASWKALLNLFNAGDREELITLLGFSKEMTAKQVADAVKAHKRAPSLRARAFQVAQSSTNEENAPPSSEVRPPYVSFAEPERDETESEPQGQEGYAPSEGPQSVGGLDATPSELSASATSDFTKATEPESTTATEPSLFGDDVVVGTPQVDNAADFFSSMGTIRNAIPERVLVPHHSYGADSSVAATIGSRASSVVDEPLKSNTFRIYPTDESSIERLVTKSIILGDFESAVSLCLSVDRFTDAIVLAIRGGPALLQRAQIAYFERHTTSFPYLRLFQSVVTNDLTDIVQNANLGEWKEIFVVLCTFAKEDEFASLAKQLGQRLEFQGQMVKSSDIEGAADKARELRNNATLCYLVAKELEKLVDIWVAELAEDEAVANEDEVSTSSQYASHARALQTFIEKVTVFRAATKYVDTDISLRTDSNDAADAPRNYKLAELYSRYYEYADLLATQGLVDDAVKYIELAPTDYKGAGGDQSGFEIARDQLLGASSRRNARATSSKTYATPAPGVPAYGYTPAVSQQSSTPYPTQGVNGGAAGAAPGPYAPRGVQSSYLRNEPYSVNGVGYVTYPSQPPAIPPPGPTVSSLVPPPPPPVAISSPHSGSGPPPKRDPGGWNDAPAIDPPRKSVPPPANAPTAITSPFPNSNSYPSTGSPPPGSPLPPPPPPRGAGGFRGHTPPPLGPPPRASSAQGPPSGQPTAPYPPPGGRPGAFPPPQARPNSTGPGGYPPRVMSPLNPAVASQGRPPQNPPPPPPSGAVLHAQGAPSAPPPSMIQSTPIVHGSQPPQYQPPLRAPSGPPPPPPPGFGRGTIPPLGQQPRGPPPPQAGLHGGQPSTPGGDITSSPETPPPPPKPAAPAAPKYSPGDHSHIPQSDMFIFEVLGGEMNRVKQIMPPQQKRMVDDTERRLNMLFDGLNAGTISRPVVEELSALVQCVQARDIQRAMAMHVELLTSGSRTDDIGLWMSGLKQLLRMI